MEKVPISSAITEMPKQVPVPKVSKKLNTQFPKPATSSRRRVNAVASAAGRLLHIYSPVNSLPGAAMDQMNATLDVCEIGGARHGAASTRAAEMFNTVFAAGRKAYTDLGMKFVPASLQGHLVAMNSMILAGIPQIRKGNIVHFSPRGRRPQKEVLCVAVAVVNQFVKADEEEWFSVPVSRKERKLLSTKFSY